MGSVVGGTLSTLIGFIIVMIGLISSDPPKGPKNAYFEAGQMIGLVMGFLFFSVGLYYLTLGIRRARRGD